MFNGLSIYTLWGLKWSFRGFYYFLDDSADSFELICFIVSNFSQVAETFYQGFIMRQSFSDCFLELSFVESFLNWFLFYFFLFGLFFLPTNDHRLYGFSFALEGDIDIGSFFLFWLFFLFDFSRRIFNTICFYEVSPFIYILYSWNQWVVYSISRIFEGFQVLFDVLNWKFEI